MSLEKATPASTRTYFETREIRHKQLGATGLEVSAIGFGGYRVLEGNAEHADSLTLALRSGCNVVDTSTNYGDGASERLIGKVLRASVREGWLQREQVVVVSKVGYIQGQNLEQAEQDEESGKPLPELVKFDHSCWHSIHPSFLEQQLDGSLHRLGLSQLDVLLLHNPEYFQKALKKSNTGTALAEMQTEFYRRISNAFDHLEKEVRRGRIQYYGISSNSFGLNSDAWDFVSLTRCLEAAEAWAKENKSPHHFRVIQLPLNLMERGAVLEPNNGTGESKTVVEYAAEKNLGVLVNRPLNAFQKNLLVRLADFPPTEVETPLAEAVHQTFELEQEFLAEFGGSIEADGLSIEDFFCWATELQPLMESPVGMESWGEIEQRARHQTTYLIEEISAQLKDEYWTEWSQSYTKALGKMLLALREAAKESSQRSSDQISKKIAPFLPESLQTLSLSQKAIASLIHSPGIDCVLNGMRRPDYVRDSIQAAQWAGEFDTSKVFRSFDS